MQQNEAIDQGSLGPHSFSYDWGLACLRFRDTGLSLTRYIEVVRVDMFLVGILCFGGHARQGSRKRGLNIDRLATCIPRRDARTGCCNIGRKRRDLHPKPEP